MLNFDKYLPHTATVQQQTIGQFGDVSVTSPSTTPCFYYYGPRRRYRSISVSEETLDHFILLPSSVTVAVGSQISGIVDLNNLLLLANSKVKQVERFTHWRTGVVLIQALLELN